METSKRFLIGHGDKRSTAVSSSPELGLILRRPEISTIAEQYGSEVRGSPGSNAIEIVPPIPTEKLKKFGEQLVSLAKTLDPSDPEPHYNLYKLGV